MSNEHETSGRSPSIGNIAMALAKAQLAITSATKGGKNPAFKRDGKVLTYSTLADVWSACHEHLNANGIAIVQMPRDVENGVEIETLLAHESGEWISSKLTMPVGANTAHATGSAITYGRRYGLAAMVGVAPEDDDGNAATDHAPAQRPSPRASQQRPPHTERAAAPKTDAKADAKRDPVKAYREATSKVTDLLERLTHAGLAVDPKGLRVDAGLSATGKPTMGELVRFADYLGQRLETLTYSQAHEDDELPDAFGAGVPGRQPGEDDWDDQDHDPTAAGAP